MKASNWTNQNNTLKKLRIGKYKKAGTFETLEYMCTLQIEQILGTIRTKVQCLLFPLKLQYCYYFYNPV